MQPSRADLEPAEDRFRIRAIGAGLADVDPEGNTRPEPTIKLPSGTGRPQRYGRSTV
jgi:hypothetical protein